MNRKINICHLTSAHPRYDTRIFLKECVSLNKKFQVNLIVADGNGNEIKNGINIYDVGILKGRIRRMIKSARNVYKKALILNCDIYHLHDPELIPYGLKLKSIGKKVIFDAHEDFPKQLLSKPYLNQFLLNILSKFFKMFEYLTCKKIDFIITATPFIREKFIKINKYCIDINNFPIIGELSNEISWGDKKNEVCYIGSISKIRGIQEIVKSFEFIEKVKLNLVGKFDEKDLEMEIENYTGWRKINKLGVLNRKNVAKVMSDSKAGIVTFHPQPNHIDSQPNKMFEYMSMGLPIVASDFPLWKDIIERNNCGICVNPLNSNEIAKAIKYIIKHPKEAEKMGKNGQKIIKERYNWLREEKKLLKVYNQLL